MTAMDEALARDVIATFILLADSIDAAAGWADLEVAGGKPPKWVIRELNLRLGTIAAAARGQAATT